jgi:hypothetical protein
MVDREFLKPGPGYVSDGEDYWIKWIREWCNTELPAREVEAPGP